jgi:hypothetical protein
VTIVSRSTSDPITMKNRSMPSLPLLNLPKISSDSGICIGELGLDGIHPELVSDHRVSDHILFAASFF